MASSAAETLVNCDAEGHKSTRTCPNYTHRCTFSSRMVAAQLYLRQAPNLSLYPKKRSTMSCSSWVPRSASGPTTSEMW